MLYFCKKILKHMCRNNLNLVFSFILGTMVLLSCQSDSKEREAARQSLEGSNGMETVVTEGGEDQIFSGPKTSIEFAEMEFDYGTVNSGDEVTKEFAFKNTGKEPLILRDVKASCGCTTPEWPKEPLSPGESGIIKAVFNTAGKSGNQVKTITVQANTTPSETVLTLKGDVLLEEK